MRANEVGRELAAVDQPDQVRPGNPEQPRGLLRGHVSVPSNHMDQYAGPELFEQEAYGATGYCWQLELADFRPDGNRAVRPPGDKCSQPPSVRLGKLESS